MKIAALATLMTPLASSNVISRSINSLGVIAEYLAILLATAPDGSIEWPIRYNKPITPAAITQ